MGTGWLCGRRAVGERMITKRDIEEARELLKEGYINITLWRSLLAIDNVYLRGEEHKLLLRTQQLIKEAKDG